MSARPGTPVTDRPVAASRGADPGTLHWDWVLRTTGKLLRPGGRDRFSWLVNLLLVLPVRRDRSGPASGVCRRAARPSEARG